MIGSFESPFELGILNSSMASYQLMLQRKVADLFFPPFGMWKWKGFTARFHASKQKNKLTMTPKTFCQRSIFKHWKFRKSCGISTQQFHFFYLNHCSTFKWSKCSRDQWHLWQPTVTNLCNTTATTDLGPWRSWSQGGEGFSGKDSDPGDTLFGMISRR